MTYEVGDRVVCVRKIDNRILHGYTGTVLHKAETGFIHVVWDEDIGGHDYCGECNLGHGWSVPSHYIEKIFPDSIDECLEICDLDSFIRSD